ncbi:MAG: DUF2304 domain-containing protein [Actinomycetota bacterium]|nr:DUF2304 domain-containing protein [Actinomycetota bacterium]
MNYVVAIVGAVVVLGFMLELLRRRQLSEKYAALWLLVGTGVLVLLVAPGLLQDASEALGFEVPANFLFLVALTLLLGVSVHLSWELSRLEDETRSLAEDLALLRSSVERLELRSRPSRDASADKEASQLDNTAQ